MASVFGPLMIGMCKEGNDMTVRQFAVMAVLAVTPEQAGREVKTLATKLNISKPAVTRALDRLSHNGLIKREEVPGDRRRVSAALTQSGKQKWASIEKKAAKAA